jgi:AP2 domain
MPRPSGKLDSKLRPNNRSGATGIYFRERTQRFIAQLQLHRRRFHIGCFDTLSEAVRARKRAEETLR